MGMNQKISAIVVVLVLLLVSVVYFAPWRLPPDPPAVYTHVKPPFMVSSATVRQIHPGRHRNEECFCLEVGFHILIGQNAVTTFKGPPVASFRIRDDGATDQIRIVRSSGSIKVDEDLAGQIARRRYAFPRDCGE